MYIRIGGIFLLYVVSVSAQINPCAFTLCTYGSQCESYEDCSEGPCITRARCVPPICMKDGLKCSSTGDCCSGCCHDGVCRKYDKSICSPCCNIKCESGSHCVEEQVFCIRAPCPPFAVCVKNPPAKYNATLKCNEPERLQIRTGCNNTEENCEICANDIKCERPIEKIKINPCRNIKCKPGSYCALIDHIFRIRNAYKLISIPVCVKDPPVKYKPKNVCPKNKILKLRSECLNKNIKNCEVCVTSVKKIRQAENPCCRLNCESGSECGLERRFCFNQPCGPLPVCSKNPPANYNATRNCPKTEKLQLRSGCNVTERNCEVCVTPVKQCLDKPSPPIAASTSQPIDIGCCCKPCDPGSSCTLTPVICIRGLCSRFPICVRDPPANYNTTLTCPDQQKFALRSGCNATEENCEICSSPAPKCVGIYNCPLELIK